MGMPEAEREEPTFTLNEYLEIEQEQEEEAQDVLGGDEGKECTYLKGYMVRQAVFVCKTCAPPGWWERQLAAAAAGQPLDERHMAGVCFACSLACHDGHEMFEIWTKRRFRCDCGNSKFAPQAPPPHGPQQPLAPTAHPAAAGAAPGSSHSNDSTGPAHVPGSAPPALVRKCQLFPDKDAVNGRNRYGQNFVGLYCGCRRPYPDPDLEAAEGEGDGEDGDELGDMRQCVVCEDWYHEGHLGLASGTEEVPEDQLEEMVCARCVGEGGAAVFLWGYRGISIPPARVGDADDRAEGGEGVTVAGEGDKGAVAGNVTPQACNGHGVGEMAPVGEKGRPAKRARTELDGALQLGGRAELALTGGGSQVGGKPEQAVKSEQGAVAAASGAAVPKPDREEADVAQQTRCAPDGPDEMLTSAGPCGPAGGDGTALASTVKKEEIPSHGVGLADAAKISDGSCRRLALEKQAEVDERHEGGGAVPGGRRALFFRKGWRDELCRCDACLALYRAAGVNFLMDADDPLARHVERAQLARAGQPSVMERATSAFTQQLHPIQQREMLHAANEMQTEFLRYFAGHAAEQRVVTPDDIQAFFAQLTAKRRGQHVI